VIQAKAPAESTHAGHTLGRGPQPYVSFEATADGGLVVERGGFGGRPAWMRREPRFSLVSTDLAWLVATSRALGLATTLDPERIAAECLLDAGAPGRTSTVYREIDELPPATRARMFPGRSSFAPIAVPRVASDLDARVGVVEELRARLATALDRATFGATHLGVLTGGGVDSGALLALASARVACVDALAISFASEGDDRPHLETLARALAIAPTRVRPSDAELPPDLTAGALPLTWPTGAVEALLMQRARASGATRVLAGLGADEWFDGDPGGNSLWPRLRRKVPWRVRRLTRRRSKPRIPPWAGPRAKGALIAAHERVLSERPWCERGAENRVRAGFIDPHLARASTLRAQLEALSGVLRVDPYLDAELAVFALSIPPRLLLGTGPREVRRGLLREALAGVLPDTVRLRPDKASFAPAHRALFAPPYLETLRPRVSVGRLADLGIIEPRAFARAFASAAAGSAVDVRLYSTLAVEAFLGGPPPESSSDAAFAIVNASR